MAVPKQKIPDNGMNRCRGLLTPKNHSLKTLPLGFGFGRQYKKMDFFKFFA
jgi:hypothetical protein